MILLTCVCAPAEAQKGQDERAIKAVWIYNIGKYSTWPRNAPQKDFVIGVIGKDPFGGYLNAITKKPIHKKNVIIRRFMTADEYTPCHILFIASEPNAERMRKRIIEIVAKTKGSPVLLITDYPGMAKQGSMINYTIDQKRQVNLEINQRGVKTSGIQISGRLMSLNVVKIIY